MRVKLVDIAFGIVFELLMLIYFQKKEKNSHLCLSEVMLKSVQADVRSQFRGSFIPPTNELKHFQKFSSTIARTSWVSTIFS